MDILTENLRKVTSDPTGFDQLISCLANGGSVFDFCNEKNIQWAELYQWINKDPSLRDQLKSAMAVRDEWAIHKILEELKRIALVDIRGAYTDTGALKRITEMPKEVAAVIQAVETKEIYDEDGVLEGQTQRVKFWDKMKAIELMMKKLNMLVEQMNVTGRVSYEDLIQSTVETQAIGASAIESETASTPDD